MLVLTDGCACPLTLAGAAQVCKEAEIDVVTIDSKEMARSVYITKGSEGPVKSDKKKAAAAVQP